MILGLDRPHRRLVALGYVMGGSRFGVAIGEAFTYRRLWHIAGEICAGITLLALSWALRWTVETSTPRFTGPGDDRPPPAAHPRTMNLPLDRALFDAPCDRLYCGRPATTTITYGVGCTDLCAEHASEEQAAIARLREDLRRHDGRR